MIGATEGAFGSILIVLSAHSVAHVCWTSLCHKGTVDALLAVYLSFVLKLPMNSA